MKRIITLSIAFCLLIPVLFSCQDEGAIGFKGGAIFDDNNYYANIPIEEYISLEGHVIATESPCEPYTIVYMDNGNSARFITNRLYFPDGYIRIKGKISLPWSTDKGNYIYPAYRIISIESIAK